MPRCAPYIPGVIRRGNRSKEDKLSAPSDNDRRDDAVGSLLISPLPRLQMSLDVHTRAFAKVFEGELPKRFAEDCYPMPFGVLADFSFLVRPGFRGCKR